MTPNLRRWVISDTHLGHTMIQKHCRRPANVDDLILGAWRRLVLPTDLVIHIGDVAFNFYPLKAAMDSLPGKKILVRGNHDSKSISYYMGHGFDFACDALVLSGCYFTHKPSEMLPEGCQYNVHGHMHNRVAADYRKYPHCRLFALEHNKYQPMLLERFLRKGCPGGEVLPRDVEPRNETQVDNPCMSTYGLEAPRDWEYQG
jgi:calcineurin-like phosphoesterase family protein